MPKLLGCTHRFSKVVVFISFFVISSCSDDDYKEVQLEPDSLIHLDQGWTPQLAVKAHHTSFGSRLIPYLWAKSLKTAEGDEFLSKVSIEKMGFLYEQESELNPLGLPVGFTLDQDKQGTEWLGLGCAACHTGEVHFKDNKIRLEGGQSLVNFTLFEKTVSDSLEQVLSSDTVFSEFYRSLKTQVAEAEIKQQVQTKLTYLKNRQLMNHSSVDYGYGRLDAFGQIFNTVGVELLGIPENKLSPDAPVSYPVLWDAPHLDVVQWNGSAPNFGPGPLFQNVTTAIAVYGTMNIINDGIKPGYPSSVNIDNLKSIQNWLWELKSPKWPEDILGSLDKKLIDSGAQIYQQKCIACHQLVDRNDPKRKLKAGLVPVKEIGTDPKMVENFLNAKVKSGSFEGDRLLFIAGSKIGQQEKSINLVAHAAAGAAANQPLHTLEAVIEDYHSVFKATIDQNPDYYKARPLTGIWASAPYLHNGSVLTLDELLSPVEERRKHFYVGDRNLDLKRVGLTSNEEGNTSLFDTSLPGNSNAGHLYGADLSNEDKKALIEYLKSL
ncbi:MAG: di-heme-cytochrome C peroxidase [Kangiellaceae bacterium]|nr:di-heme-cytochrome C peroxidase [Kangiellaceae bacterium]